MALNKPLETIDENDLQTLVDNQVSEHKTLEYKEALPGNADGDKKEFLADTSSFANALGGDLIYGIREQSGVPVELSGLELSDVDAEILRLESCIQTGIAPRLFRIVETHPVLLSTKQRYAIIIRVRKSWTAPHMVTFKNDSKFFSRNSRGKYQLDVSELKSAFLLSETAAERIKNFRTERLSNIIAAETPVALHENAPKFVLHIVPFGAFEVTTRYDLSMLTRNYNAELEPPAWTWNSGGYSYPQYNFDGLQRESTTSGCYVQLFRNGCIEVVDSFIVASMLPQLISASLYEQRILVALKRYFGLQRLLDIDPPIFIMVSLLGVKGFTIVYEGYDNFRFDIQDHQIDRPDLIVPEIMVESFHDDIAEVMKPIFDTLANAAKWPGSKGYNQDGKSLYQGL